MHNLCNVDKSAFRRGEYVGFACGERFRIRRNGREWIATVETGPYRPRLYARTLRELSRMLTELR